MSFHVPEPYRVPDGPMGSNATYGNKGAFILPSPLSGRHLIIIASDGRDWEHVSVHAEKKGGDRLPTWPEMCFVKDLFWDPEDVVMQLHPRRSEYVNHHPCVLHLWRPVAATIPEPPSILVGPLAQNPAGEKALEVAQ